MKFSRLLFVHSSERLRVDANGAHYTTGSLTEEVWPRYLSIADKITLCVQMDEEVYSPEKAQRTFQPIMDTERITFLQLPRASGALKRLSPSWHLQREKLLKAAIEAHDGLIIRLPGGAGLSAARIARKLEKLYLVEVVGCIWDALWNHSLQGKVAAPAIFLATRRAIRNAPMATYVTERFLQSRYPTRGVSRACSDVALTPVEDDVLRKRIAGLSGRSRGQPLVLGTIAAVDVRYKGHDSVIRAMAELKSSGLKMHYRLAGGGDRTRLQQLAEDLNVGAQIEFTGRLNHESIFSYLEQLDVYIQPSYQEGLSRALVEAMSRGVPALASHAGGNGEIVPNEYLFEPGSTTQIARLLKQLTPAIMEQMAASNFERAKNFDPQELERKRLAIFKEFAQLSTAEQR